MMLDAVAIMAGRKISELPVVDADGKPSGLIDITDVVALLPKEAATSEPAASSSTKQDDVANCGRSWRRSSIAFHENSFCETASRN